MVQFQPRTEFTTALTQIAAERGVSPEVVLETIKAAILAAYRKDAKERGEALAEEEEFEVQMDPQTGEAKIFKLKGRKKIEVTPPGFSRIAAQTAKQIILQKIREAEKSAILADYSQRAGSLISGLILRFEGPNTIVDIGKTEAVMLPSEQVKSERYQPNQRLTFYLQGIKETPRGQQVIVSRSSEGLVKGLFGREVPEVGQSVEIVRIARDPGVRTKIAVQSNQPGVDPVGSCVGQKGVRVKEVIEELFGEKIDIIQYNQDPVKFVTSALSPAENLKVEIEEDKKVAKVVAPEDQLSLTIGSKGQNVRLASKLTGYKIDILGEKEAPKVKAKLSKKTVSHQKRKKSR